MFGVGNIEPFLTCWPILDLSKIPLSPSFPYQPTNETAIHLRNEYEKQQIQIKGILEQNEILKEQNKIITEKYNKILEEINKIKKEKRETKYKN